MKTLTWARRVACAICSLLLIGLIALAQEGFPESSTLSIPEVEEQFERYAQALSQIGEPLYLALWYVTYGLVPRPIEDLQPLAKSAINLLEGEDGSHYDESIQATAAFSQGILPILADFEFTSLIPEMSGLRLVANDYHNRIKLARKYLLGNITGETKPEDRRNSLLSAQALLFFAFEWVESIVEHYGLELWVQPGESIQAAVDQARDGATIHIESGIYRETLEISKNITLDGSAFEMPEQLAGGGISYGVSLEPVASQSGIVINSLDAIRVEIRQISIGKASQGIEVAGNAHVTAEQLTITESGTGIDVSDSASIELLDCDLAFNGTGATSRGGSIIASQCRFSDNTSGIRLYFGASGMFLDCVVERSTTSDADLPIQNAISVYCSDLILENCLIRDNQGNGITLGGGEDSRLHMIDCQITGNAFGLELVFGSCNPGTDPNWEAPTSLYDKSHGTATGWNNVIPGPDEPDGNLLGSFEYYYRDYIDPSFLTEPKPVDE